jgi:hypothetical protein
MFFFGKVFGLLRQQNSGILDNFLCLFQFVLFYLSLYMATMVIWGCAYGISMLRSVFDVIVKFVVCFRITSPAFNALLMFHYLYSFRTDSMTRDPVVDYYLSMKSLGQHPRNRDQSGLAGLSTIRSQRHRYRFPHSKKALIAGRHTIKFSCFPILRINGPRVQFDLPRFSLGETLYQKRPSHWPAGPVASAFSSGLALCLAFYLQLSGIMRPSLAFVCKSPASPRFRKRVKLRPRSHGKKVRPSSL